MWRQRVAFIFIYMALLAIDIAFPNYLLFAARASLVLLLAVSGLLLLAQSGTFSCTVERPGADKCLYGVRNEPMEIPLRIRNKSILPLFRVRVRLGRKSCFDEKPEYYQLISTVSGQCEMVLSVHFVPPHCGRHEWNVRDITLYDWFGFFCKKVRVNDTVTLIVRPSCRERLPQQETDDGDGKSNENARSKHLEESDFYQDHEVGELPPELLEIRAFQRGDRLREIHWKLSAKKDEWFVRRYSMPQKLYKFVFFDYAPKTADEADRLLLCLAKTCEEQIEQNISVFLLWYDESQKCFSRYIVMTEDDMHDVVDEACKMPPNRGRHADRYLAETGLPPEQMTRIG